MKQSQSNADKVRLSLFDHSGNWSKFYRDNGYTVYQVDLKFGDDIMLYDYKQHNNVYGILAAPPCTVFTKAGNMYWKLWNDNGRTNTHKEIIYKTLEIIEYFKPKFWCIENPPGRLDTIIPELKKYRLLYVQPYQFGDGYSKNTVLWGVFNPFLLQAPVNFKKATNITSSIDLFYNIDKLKFKKRSSFRNITPLGFSLSFFNANT